jgi:hypothetical protein
MCNRSSQEFDHTDGDSRRWTTRAKAAAWYVLRNNVIFGLIYAVIERRKGPTFLNHWAVRLLVLATTLPWKLYFYLWGVNEKALGGSTTPLDQAYYKVEVVVLMAAISATIGFLIGLPVRVENARCFQLGGCCAANKNCSSSATMCFAIFWSFALMTMGISLASFEDTLRYHIKTNPARFNPSRFVIFYMLSLLVKAAFDLLKWLGLAFKLAPTVWAGYCTPARIDLFFEMRPLCVPPYEQLKAEYERLRPQQAPGDAHEDMADKAHNEVIKPGFNAAVGDAGGGRDQAASNAAGAAGGGAAGGRSSGQESSIWLKVVCCDVEPLS